MRHLGRIAGRFFMVLLGATVGVVVLVVILLATFGQAPAPVMALFPVAIAAYDGGKFANRARRGA
ncbi:MAG: hypothetical protein ACU0CO_05455, partial [Shimia sp.]